MLSRLNRPACIKFRQHFEAARFVARQGLQPAFNRRLESFPGDQFERIQHFIILHYKLTQRDDSPMWRATAAMDVPDTLQLKLDHFRKYGRLLAREMDLFAPASWLAVHIGQLNFPEHTDPLADYRGVDGREWLAKLRAAMFAAAAQAPTHQQFIDRHCKAGSL